MAKVKIFKLTFNPRSSDKEPERRPLPKLNNVKSAKIQNAKE